VKLEMNCADPTDDEAKLYALADVHDMILELHDLFRIDVDAKREMNRVVRRIRQGEFLLNDPTRFFLREGDLVKRSNRTGRSTSYRFFLFSDVIIYASATTSHDNFKIHEELPLHLMKITDWFPDRRQQMKKAFQVHHPRKSFIVFADSVEERQSWVKDIREAIAKEVERLTHLENARLAAASVER
jgi:PH domain